MSEPVWVVRAGRSGIYAKDFVEKGVVAVGFGNIADLGDLQTREQALALIREEFPDFNATQHTVHAGQLFRFRQLPVGSAVMTYEPEERLYHVGRVKGDYAFRPGYVDRYSQTKDVEWLAKIPRDVLSADTKNSLGAISTIFQISDEAAAEVLTIVRGGTSSQQVITASEAAIVESDVKEAEVEIRKNIEQQALEFLQDRVSRLDWVEMQELVAGLLRAMGYKTRISDPGADQGRDIVASPDGFGFQSPRILVEVKHRKGTIGAPDVRSFLGGLRQGDNGLYVSTGGFTREARYEAHRANHHLSLMDSVDFGKAIMDHYDRMDAEARALLPMKKIYWPA